MAFRDREDAGRRLAARLGHLAGARPVVLGVPRGGVPVAAEVARALRAPLGVVGVRKVGAPIQPELAIGAVAEGDVAVIDRETARRTGVGPEEVKRLVAERRAELAERMQALRGDAPGPDVRHRTVVIVDDGHVVDVRVLHQPPDPVAVGVARRGEHGVGGHHFAELHRRTSVSFAAVHPRR